MLDPTAFHPPCCDFEKFSVVAEIKEVLNENKCGIGNKGDGVPSKSWFEKLFSIQQVIVSNCMYLRIN